MESFQKAKNTGAIALLMVMLVFSVLNYVLQLPANIDDSESSLTWLDLADFHGTTTWLDDVLNAELFGQTQITQGYSYIQRLMGKEEAGAFDIIKSKTGETIYGNLYPSVLDELPTLALRMQRMQEYCETQGTDVLFWGAPALYTRGYSQYSAGLPAYDQNAELDAMLYYLQSYGVDYLDSRTVLKDSDIPPEQYRFKTDLHWTIESCFACYGALVEKLDADYGAALDPDGFYTDLSNYSCTLYQDSYLGALGKRAGAPFSGVDDITLIWPDFKTDFSVQIQDFDVFDLASGSYIDVMVDHDYLENTSLYDGSLYNSYLGGSKAFWQIKNNLKLDGPKVLRVCDSFALPAATFLASAVGELHVICPQDTGGGEPFMDITKYIRNNDFDQIIVEFYPGNFTHDSFAFFY